MNKYSVTGDWNQSIPAPVDPHQVKKFRANIRDHFAFSNAAPEVRIFNH